MTLLYSEHKRLYFWNAVVMACTTFMALYIPLGFELDIAPSPVLTALYWLCNLVFVADIFVRYLRYKRERSADTDSSIPFPAVLGIVDIIPAIPFGLIPGTGYLQLLRLIKLIRVHQFIRLFKQAEVRFSISLTLISFVYWTGILMHFLACGWMQVYSPQATADNLTNYISSLYWTVTTLTSVGYGDILPVTNLERVYAMLVQVAGLGVFGYLVGNVVTIITKLDAGKARYEEMVDLLGTATKRRGLPRDLQRRVLDYYRYMRDDSTGYDESAFLRTLPKALRTEVALNLKKEFIEGIPLFRNASDGFIIDIALKLKLVVATPGDYIFKIDEPGDTMYFVVSGILEVLNKKEDHVLATMQSGDFFGEIALFRNTPRSASIKATTFCNLYKLNRGTFESVLVDYPEIGDHLRQEAINREQRYLDD